MQHVGQKPGKLFNHNPLQKNLCNICTIGSRTPSCCTDSNLPLSSQAIRSLPMRFSRQPIRCSIFFTFHRFSRRTVHDFLGPCFHSFSLNLISWNFPVSAASSEATTGHPRWPQWRESWLYLPGCLQSSLVIFVGRWECKEQRHLEQHFVPSGDSPTSWFFLWLHWVSVCLIWEGKIEYLEERRKKRGWKEEKKKFFLFPKIAGEIFSFFRRGKTKLIFHFSFSFLFFVLSLSLWMNLSCFL